MTMTMKIALVIAAGLLLSACQHNQATTSVVSGGSFCEIARPIFFKAGGLEGDTRRTIEQVDAHNRKGKALCGWGAKKK